MNKTIDFENVYNTEYKESFLTKYDNHNTKRAYVRVFRNTHDMEVELDKDLCFFTREELDLFFQQTSPTTKISARNYGRMIVQYLQWAVDENIIPMHPFPMQQHYFLKYVKQENDIYLKKEELQYFTDMYFKNLQDGIIVELLFNGVQGTEANEICNLTVNDLDFDNHSMRLNDEVSGVERTIFFEDNRLLKLCQQANKEDKYEKRNGETEPNPRIRPYTDLFMDTPYVLKNSKVNTTHENKTTKYTIYNRLKNIQKFEETEEIKHKFTIKNIVKSGQLYMASKLYEQEGELDLDQIKKIVKHFGGKVHWSLRDYLNEENLFKIYPHVKKFKKQN